MLQTNGNVAMASPASLTAATMALQAQKSANLAQQSFNTNGNRQDRIEVCLQSHL